MDVMDFCNGLEMELTAWKAKLYDMNNKIDRLGSSEKERALGNFGDLKIALAELEERIHRLKTECPSEWSPQKREIDDSHVDMRSKYEETMELIGKAAPVSIPG